MIKSIFTPQKHKEVVVIIVAIYPLITLTSYLIGDLLMPLPIAVRTLILSIVTVPIMVYFLVPMVMRLLRPWL